MTAKSETTKTYAQVEAEHDEAVRHLEMIRKWYAQGTASKAMVTAAEKHAERAWHSYFWSTPDEVRQAA